MLHLLGLLLQRPRPHGRSLLTYASAGDPQTLTGRSGSLSFGHHCSFPWVLVHTRCLCPPSIYLVAAPKYISSVQFSRSVMSDSVTPWTTARQASLSITSSWSLPKLMSIELVMPSNYLILCRPLSSCLQPFPSSGSFQMSWFFTSGGQILKFQLQHQSFQ